ncbi:MAG TPA: hypothetical protein VGR65_02495 [Casimicrobiaceae bacterium]|nr:hypothetical protein [Casimicrobiaceae bacterium]
MFGRTFVHDEQAGAAAPDRRPCRDAFGVVIPAVVGQIEELLEPVPANE